MMNALLTRGSIYNHMYINKALTYNIDGFRQESSVFGRAPRARQQSPTAGQSQVHRWGSTFVQRWTLPVPSVVGSRIAPAPTGVVELNPGPLEFTVNHSTGHDLEALHRECTICGRRDAMFTAALCWITRVSGTGTRTRAELPFPENCEHSRVIPALVWPRKVSGGTFLRELRAQPGFPALVSRAGRKRRPSGGRWDFGVTPCRTRCAHRWRGAPARRPSTARSWSS